MTNLLYSKKIVIFICVLAAVVLILSFLALNAKPAPSNKPPSFTIAPSAGSTLPLGTPATLILTSNQPFLSSYKTDVTQHVVGTSTTSEATFSSQLEPGSQSVILTLDNLTPNTIYTITVTNTLSHSQLFQALFATNQPVPTPLAANNLNLTRYLPYETINYILRYDPSQNLYIFDFKIDPNSSAPSGAQFEQAKSDAVNFIKSKGIDPSSLTIDWRRT